MKPIFILVALCLSLSSAVAGVKPRAADRWEKALLDRKARGTLPGPKPGQKCLWSKRLGACLWYTPGKLNLRP